MDPFASAADLLKHRSGRPLPFTPDHRPLEAGPLPSRSVAVDGSHAVLVDNGAVWVVAVSAAAVPWNPDSPPPMPCEPAVHAAVPADAPQQVADAYAPLGLEPPRVRSAEAYAEALRDLAELQAARDALEGMGGDDLLLVDGALENLAPGARRLADRLLEKGEATGVPVAGVAKRSRLDSGGVPLVSTLHARGPPGAWSVAVPDYRLAHVARLHPDAPHAFRVDATDAGSLSALVPLARDVVYLGYPYPLAVAHNTVALTGHRVHDLRSRLVEAVRVQAGPEAFRLLEDFHAVLDRNVP